MRFEYQPYISTASIWKYNILRILVSKLFIGCFLGTCVIVLASEVFEGISGLHLLLVFVVGMWASCGIYCIYKMFDAIRIDNSFKLQRWFCFDENGFGFRVDTFCKNIKWKNFHKIVERKNHFYLIQCSGQGTYIVPKEKLSRNEVETIRDIFSAAPVGNKKLFFLDKINYS